MENDPPGEEKANFDLRPVADPVVVCSGYDMKADR